MGFNDDNDNSIPVIDLLVMGVWYPVTTHLADKFPNIFSVGIAETLHRAYCAVESFTAELSSLLPGGDLSSLLFIAFYISHQSFIHMFRVRGCWHVRACC